MSNNEYLDFVVIGAMKAGTTSLYNYLTKHPELSLPYTEKEVNFFNNDEHWSMGIDWYAKNFKENTLKRGEVNPNYAMFPRCQLVPTRLHQFSPNVKIIYVLRDPIERFRSHIHHNYIKGLENRGIDEILEDKNDSLWYISYSKYCYQIEKILDFFNHDQLMILTLEELTDNPVSVMNSIFKFLGVKENAHIGDYTEINHASNEKVKAGKILNAIRKTPLINLYQSIKEIMPHQVHISAKRILGKYYEKPELSENQITYLKEVFREDIAGLEELTERNFLCWIHDYTRSIY
ncbi:MULTISPECIES: sulfotransferase domain-containing protein [Cyanophyceae]|uniref:sulfotransferase domain-containing protein n=1 Tax=Cyanophyceae TaxID=3028117 RepID=UPI00016DC8E0|nr:MULTISPECIES: sulfotransferase domain-containing protein [Cyanophyceae]ACA99499.1 putative sulfotransferase [Picosynechococcus sp. PCC 7002]SMH30364.1 Sulfotransferase domain-containing protein [Picosynechococcus sp. OG1]SMQ83878.1 Sulfotransferase domain-containing protein [Synechococcus sp. 7002]